jgi:hypothetical protein
VATNFATQSESWLKHLYNSRLGRAFMTSPETGAEQLVSSGSRRPPRHLP